MSNYRCCPICFRGGHEAPTNVPPEEQKLKKGESLTLEQRFFRVFARYIDIRDDNGEFPLDKLTDNNLICCGECTKVMESFCELYHKMKTIELHLNWKALTLKNIMMGSKRVAKRTANFEECVKLATKNHRGRDAGDADKIIKSMMKTRNTLIEKCCQKLTNGFPKILIQKKSRVYPHEQCPIGIHPTQKQITDLPDGNSTADSKIWECNVVADEGTPVELVADPGMVSPPDIIDNNDDNEEATGNPSSLLESTNRETYMETVNDINETAQIKVDLDQKMEMDIGTETVPLPDLLEVPILNGTSKVERSLGGLRSSFHCTHCSMRFSLVEKLKRHITEVHNCEKGSIKDVVSSSSESDDGENESDEGENVNGSCEDDNVSLSSTSISSNDSEAELDEDLLIEEAIPEVKMDVTERPNSKEITTVPPGNEKPSASAKKSRNYKTFNKKYGNTSSFRLKCPDCEELFKDFKPLLLHRKNSNACEGKYDPATSIRVEVRILGNPKTVGFTITSAVIDLPQAIFVCEECDLALYLPEHADTHKKLHGTFPCKFCKVTKTYAPELAIHELKHKSENKIIKGGRPGPNQTAFCPRCDFQCSYSTNTAYVKHHLKSHLSLIYVNPVCAICQADTLKKNNILRHLQQSHDLSQVTAPVDIKRCTIDECKAYFLSSKKLTIHIRRYHNLLNRRYRKEEVNASIFRYTCQYCEKSYLQEVNLRKHRIQAHVSSSETFSCPIDKCFQIFESKRELDWHIKISTKFHSCLENPPKEKPSVLCPQCNKPFADKRALKIHSKSHRRTLLVCDICGMVFKYKARLESHYLHHKKPQHWKFECEICNKKCPSNGKLKEHMRTHTQEKKFICQVCGAKYAARRNLRVHVNSKHGDVVQDIPRKINKTNFKSRKGIKRWKLKQVSTSSSSSSSSSSETTNNVNLD